MTSADSVSGRPGGSYENSAIMEGDLLLCRVCFEQGERVPTHPEHPNSPYCRRHWTEARTANTRKWRAAKKAQQGLYSPPHPEEPSLSEVIRELVKEWDGLYDSPHPGDDPAKIAALREDVATFMAALDEHVIDRLRALSPQQDE